MNCWEIPRAEFFENLRNRIPRETVGGTLKITSEVEFLPSGEVTERATAVISQKILEKLKKSIELEWIPKKNEKDFVEELLEEFLNKT